MDISDFRRLPLLGILRGIDEEIIEPLTETVISSGLRAIEITMNTPRASELITRMSTVADGRIAVGAGTVMTTGQLQEARKAGASFIVLPVLIPEVVRECVRDGIPVFPGALSPQEIHAAWQAGATMVKVFPASAVGPNYFREVRGPFDDIELLACGGVNAGNIASFFSAGTAAVAFGASIFREERFRARDFAAIGKDIKELIERGKHGSF